MERLLVVDNHDSFTYNLVHLLEALTDIEVEVYRTEAVTEEIFESAAAVVFSPGPGLPHEMPNLMHWVGLALKTGRKTLGVCLGHQALAVATGGTLRNLGEVHHGVSHEVSFSGEAPLFRGLPMPFLVGRYHSWVVEANGLSSDWRIDARDERGVIMAMSHLRHPIFGVQFHPESILTPEGRRVLSNFLNV